ncbi:RusA family crossover junction endodeoxyribonuclease [Chromobacterium haemolyticum]|uniref:RusA family crossover junction endodeoxyribonuclease n=1 Tax=Chromobacterium haemolyticum TaxID=394935 RepID=UPI001746E120|nr:RusA family crossover junction endodeoxyribonuclease [Chromobacterium haemolyticum]QOD84843.1 RusA family crossover junction endodeoxyribonuclease [Chromobacterium haemolyticum]
MNISFFVPGAPVGKGRPRAARRKGKAGKEYIAQITPEKTVNYESLVALASAQAMEGRPPMCGPVELGVVMYLPIPASWSNKKKAAALAGDLLPMVKPDMSNVVKAIEDGMNGVVYADDCQIVDYAPSKKRYSDKPGVEVTVREIAGALFAA